MNNQQSYSPGLLYSVEPEDLSTLHLNDDNVMNEFDWGQEEDYALGQKLLDYFKINTARMIKRH